MELSPKEKRRIEKLSLIPAAIVTYIFIGLFVYLTLNDQLFSFYFRITYFVSIFLFVMPAVLFFTEIVLVSRKTGKSFRAYFKVFFGRILLCAFGAALFGGILSIAYLTLLPILGETLVVILGGATWFTVFGIIVVRYEERLNKISNGES